MKRGCVAGKEQYNEGIQWMDGCGVMYDLRFSGMDRNDGGLYKMHIPFVLCGNIGYGIK